MSLVNLQIQVTPETKRRLGITADADGRSMGREAGLILEYLLDANTEDSPAINLELTSIWKEPKTIAVSAAAD